MINGIPKLFPELITQFYFQALGHVGSTSFVLYYLINIDTITFKMYQGPITYLLVSRHAKWPNYMIHAYHKWYDNFDTIIDFPILVLFYNQKNCYNYNGCWPYGWNTEQEEFENSDISRRIIKILWNLFTNAISKPKLHQIFKFWSKNKNKKISATVNFQSWANN